MVKIREITEKDAEAFLEMGKRLDNETKFLAYEPDERDMDVSRQRKQIREILSKGNSTIFVAQDGERLVGFLEAKGGNYRRNRHSIHITIGILQEYTGKGLGTKFFETVERWAKDKGFHRLELIFLSINGRARGLYEKMGFEVEGIKRDSFRVDGVYIDEIFMSKILENQKMFDRR